VGKDRPGPEAGEGVLARINASSTPFCYLRRLFFQRFSKLTRCGLIVSIKSMVHFEVDRESDSQTGIRTGKGKRSPGPEHHADLESRFGIESSIRSRRWRNWEPRLETPRRGHAKSARQSRPLPVAKARCRPSAMFHEIWIRINDRGTLSPATQPYRPICERRDHSPHNQ
jgi:hypothetical protein